jgi:hypothetical protein
LVELGEREGGAQAKAARTLLFRDCESGLARSAAGCGIARLTPRKNFAAQATQLGVERLMTDASGGPEHPSTISGSWARFPVSRQENP